MGDTSISWTHYTFNPWLGCTKVSSACDHCYAEAWAKRAGKPELWVGDRKRTSEQNWKMPVKWNRKAEDYGIKANVFCASLADVFDNQVPIQWRADLFQLIADTPHLLWLLLTKRPQNIKKMLPDDWGDGGYPNVWLGTTAENQKEADRRVPDLLDTPAAYRFVSAEPLLGFIDFRPWLPRVKWIISGGESGPGYRATDIAWHESIMRQCRDAGVAYHFKQDSAAKPGKRGRASDELWVCKDVPGGEA